MGAMIFPCCSKVFDRRQFQDPSLVSIIVDTTSNIRLYAISLLITKYDNGVCAEILFKSDEVFLMLKHKPHSDLPQNLFCKTESRIQEN